MLAADTPFRSCILMPGLVAQDGTVPLAPRTVGGDHSCSAQRP